MDGLGINVNNYARLETYHLDTIYYNQENN